MPSVDHPLVSTCELVVSGQAPGSKIICRPYAGSGVKPDYVVDRRNGKHVYFREIEKTAGSSGHVVFSLFPGNRYLVAVYGPDERFKWQKDFSMPDEFLEFGNPDS